MATKILIIPDIHVPHHDARILRLIKKFQSDFKPHHTVQLGDLICADQVSSFPNDEDTDLYTEFQMAQEVLGELKVTHLILGNHDWGRLTRPGLVPRNMRGIVDPVRNLQLDKRGIHWLPYDHGKYFQFGHLKMLHGFWANKYSANKHALAYGNVVFGHTHRIQIIHSDSLDSPRCAYNIGCCCRLDQPYMIGRPPAGWNHGFGFAYIHKSGNFNMYVCEIIDYQFTVHDKCYR